MLETTTSAVSESWPVTFRDAVCQAFGIPPQDYALKVFRRGLYRHAWLIGLLIYRVKPEFFKEDFSLIEELGRVRNPEIFKSELNYFFGRNRRDKGFFRTTFAIRVSARRLIKLKNRVLPK